MACDANLCMGQPAVAIVTPPVVKIAKWSKQKGTNSAEKLTIRVKFLNTATDDLHIALKMCSRKQGMPVLKKVLKQEPI